VEELLNKYTIFICINAISAIKNLMKEKHIVVIDQGMQE
jgi:hypothetical protein